MKEIFKSKVILLFIAFVLGVTYVNSSQLSRLENLNDNVEVVSNIK